MQLYVVNRKGEKNILDISASTRNELARKIGYEFLVKNEYYDVNDVKAEASSSDTASGAVIGGILGLLGGGIGALIGGVAGGLIGGIRDEEENKLIAHFNRSRA
jgi:outer membrane lipoprotein SlyB